MQALFQLAAERGGDIGAEHRAAIIVMAFYVNGKGLGAIIPAARQWPTPLPLGVTLADRGDLAQHFTISAALAATAGSPLADAVGLYKELDDSRSGSGFSFSDLAADRAGTRFGALATGPDMGLRNISRQLQSLDKRLSSLAAFFQEPHPIPGSTAARTLMLVFQAAHADLSEAPEVQWIDELDGQQVSVDTDLLSPVFRELLSNAAVFSAEASVTVIAKASEREVIFELREPKPEPMDTTGWGQPFLTTRHGGYSLGLWSARRLLQANGKSWWLPKTLVVRHDQPEKNPV